jgi:hypothetical protein
MTANICRCDEVASSLGPTPAEVAYAFMTDSLALSAEQRAQLRQRGVPESVIDHDPGSAGGPIRAARVVYAAGYFDFSDEPEANVVYIIVARDWRGVSSDIVAFGLDGRTVPWLRREALLGAHNVLGPSFNEPLRVFPNILAWLRGERDGVVVLDWRRAAAELEGATLAVDDLVFGQTLRRRLTRPSPPIVVRHGAKAVAA